MQQQSTKRRNIKQGNTKAPMVRKRNPTMENIMKQKTKGEDWGTARKRLINEALKRKPNFIRREPPRQQRTKKKKCKNCPG